MVQEDKELLIKDLCARLPYGVKGIVTYDESNTTFVVEGIDNDVLHLSDAEECYVEDFKPYLRPTSSMTEEERNTFDTMTRGYTVHQQSSLFDWLNAHHLDFRGLIEKGLAIPAPVGMILKLHELKKL